MSSFIPVADAADLQEGDVLTATVGGASVVITRVGGVLYALDNVCSHDQSPFDEATMDGYELCCPRHEGRFDVRSGKATRFPAVWPISAWPVKEEEGRIWVDVAPQTRGAG
ncbi:MAG: ferredoxin [Dehalococcoidia bacterium]|nr:MAG: ferredoxin [Dehalococcoidia bacterium]